MKLDPEVIIPIGFVVAVVVIFALVINGAITTGNTYAECGTRLMAETQCTAAAIDAYIDISPARNPCQIEQVPAFKADLGKFCAGDSRILTKRMVVTDDGGDEAGAMLMGGAVGYALGSAGR